MARRMVVRIHLKSGQTVTLKAHHVKTGTHPESGEFTSITVNDKGFKGEGPHAFAPESIAMVTVQKRRWF